MSRYLVPLIAAILATPGLFAEAGPQPQTIPIQMQAPKTNVTIRTVTLDTAGAVTPEGQKILDEMTEDGWRAMSMSTVSTGQPTTIAVMFAKVSRPPGPPMGMPRPGPPQAGQPPQGAPQGAGPHVQALPPPAPAPEHNP